MIFSSYIHQQGAPHRDQLPGHRPSIQSIDVQRAHRLLVADAPDRLRQQARHRQLPDALARRAPASDSGIVSVTTSSSSTDFAMRSIAAPDSTGCVM